MNHRFLALGDSYTIGESVPDSVRWPEQLVKLVRKQKYDLGDPEILAQTGWTTTDLLHALDREQPTGPYSLVTLMIGVNNQFQGKTPEEYRTELTTLVTRAIQLANNNRLHVIVISIPDWGVTPFATGRDRGQIAAEIDRFNAINREVTVASGILYADITPASRGAATDSTLIASDGIHPSAKLHAIWADIIFPAALGTVMPIRHRTK